ncbi:MAG TPA: GNAT family N-acetyltransferase [Candidatus Nitrosotenuis sp.]|jgi:glucosamine-phosphate N-acetyltransferase|nr:GNAT family N-acetyltransferase [Candidatus Nitrosotenuis sp.]
MSEITIRKITEADIDKGFLESLDSLRKASDLDRQKAKSILKKLSQNPDHVIFVAVEGDRVVGSTTLLIEQKFIHGGGKVGHIEDVVVDAQHQGKGIGEMIIKYVLDYAKKQGCYKTILDCDDRVKPFYEKLGFEHHSNGMRYNH